MIAYDVSPEAYRYWELTVDPPVAILTLRANVGDDGDGADDSDAQLASLLRVDIELFDAVRRLRFEYPDVAAVVVTGSTNQAFSTGIAEIPPGAAADVAAFVRSFRDEVRSAIEDASADSGQHWLAALNGPASGPGYELALATEEIVLIEDGFTDVVTERARTAAGQSRRAPASEAVQLGPLLREEFDGGFAYPNVRVEFDRDAGAAALTIIGPSDHECFAPEPGPRRLRYHWWPLAVCREVDDALLLLRSHGPEVRSLVLRTEGDPLAVASADVALTSGYEHDWFVREVVFYWNRVLKRLDLAWQSVFALIEPGSCFVGTLLELALAADRAYMADGSAELFLTSMNFGPLPRASGLTRLESRFRGRDDHVAALALRVGDPISAAEAAELGLVTEAIPRAEWERKIRLAIEDRAGLTLAARAGLARSAALGTHIGPYGDL